jgi:hypothetical protein
MKLPSNHHYIFILIFLGFDNFGFSSSIIALDKATIPNSFLFSDAAPAEAQYRILDADQTLASLKSIKIINNERDYPDIQISAKNGRKAYFSS